MIPERELPFQIVGLSSAAANDNYDLGVWTAGYESRASWLIESVYKPVHVRKWYRVEFLEDRGAYSAPQNLGLGLGEPVGGTPGSRASARHWLEGWRMAARETWKGRPLRLFLDISSMPRTVFGSLLFLILRNHIAPVESVTIAYVPGEYSDPYAGSRQFSGLCSLVGTEGVGTLLRGDPAFVLSLGFDGPLAETIVEIYQVGRFSSLLAFPGVSHFAEEEAVRVNRSILERSEHVAVASARDAEAAFWQLDSLVDWYRGVRDVVLVPMGPKVHVVASILLALSDQAVILRGIRGSNVRPVEVTVAPDAEPVFFRIVFRNAVRGPEQYNLFSVMSRG